MGKSASKAFKEYDMDNDGFITAEDLKLFMEAKIAEKVKEKEKDLNKEVDKRIKKIVETVDTDSDGKIGEAEFKKLKQNEEAKTVFDKSMNFDEPFEAWIDNET